MSPSALLVAQDLAARRGAALLWQAQAFALAAGEALVVRGTNGSGKTTLLRILAGLTRPEQGTLAWRGRTVQPYARELRSEMLFIGHASALHDELTAVENLALLSSLAGEDDAMPRLRDALAAVDLARQALLPARVLSQGQRRRVHLARLASTTRPLWILDEPATALDQDGLAWLQATLATHLEGGGLAVLATHTPIALPAGRTRELQL